MLLVGLVGTELDDQAKSLQMCCERLCMLSCHARTTQQTGQHDQRKEAKKEGCLKMWEYGAMGRIYRETLLCKG